MANEPEDLPSGAGEVARAYPDVWAAYAALGKACSLSGPLDRHTARLVKLALAIGARLAGWRGEVLAYEVWSTLWPNMAVDIGAVAGEKEKLIRLYASQTSDRDYAAAILGLNRFRGMQHRVEFAEAFHRSEALQFQKLTACLDSFDS